MLAIGRLLPRYADAYFVGGKFEGWILASPGHGGEWETVFGIGPNDADLLWNSIKEAIESTHVSRIRDKDAYGILAEVRVDLTIGERTATVVTAWHFANDGDPPKLVTAYPAP